MRMRRVALALLALYVVAVTVVPLYAAAHTLTYSSAQDTRLLKVVKNYVARKCAAFGRGKTCSSAQLVNSGCVAVTVCQAAGLKTGSNQCTDWSDKFTESCVSFTQDSAGIEGYLLEQANKAIANELAIIKAQDAADFCESWDQMSNSAQNTVCTTAPPAGLGLSNNCRPCPEQP